MDRARDMRYIFLRMRRNIFPRARNRVRLIISKLFSRVAFCAMNNFCVTLARCAPRRNPRGFKDASGSVRDLLEYI